MDTRKSVYSVFAMEYKLETTVTAVPTCLTLLGMATSVNATMVTLKLMRNVFPTMEEFQVQINHHHVLSAVTLITIIGNVLLVLMAA